MNKGEENSVFSKNDSVNPSSTGLPDKSRSRSQQRIKKAPLPVKKSSLENDFGKGDSYEEDGDKMEVLSRNYIMDKFKVEPSTKSFYKRLADLLREKKFDKKIDL
jgi:hypothetical protein